MLLCFENKPTQFRKMLMLEKNVEIFTDLMMWAISCCMGPTWGWEEIKVCWIHQETNSTKPLEGTESLTGRWWKMNKYTGETQEGNQVSQSKLGKKSKKNKNSSAVNYVCCSVSAYCRRYKHFPINCVLKEKSGVSFNFSALTLKQKKQRNILNIY